MLAAAMLLAFFILCNTRQASAQPILDPLYPPPEFAIEITADTPAEIVVATAPFPSLDEVHEVEPPPIETFGQEGSDFAPEGKTDESAVDPATWEQTWRVRLPTVRYQPPPTTLVMGSRSSVLAYYNAFFRIATPPMGWTGNYGACSAGATSAAYLEATRKRIAYYRAMAGVPSGVVMHAPFVQQAQYAALMMSANKRLDHSPSSGWRCYSAEGTKAAGKANLASAPGPAAIDMYMYESGGNSAVGHRRWLLYPQLTRMGSGSTPPSGDLFGSNVLYVIDDEVIWGARPAVRDGYVAWPPRGYVPHTIVPMRWSFSYPNADFSSASVSMWRNGAPLGAVKEPLAANYGENTLVWLPQIGSSEWPAPVADTTFDVRISNVRINGANQTFAYTVIIFNPG